MTHTCHWPGCAIEVPPDMYACPRHWAQLPWAYRERILETYRVGQETTKDPSREYIRAAEWARDWAAGYDAGRAAP